MFDRSRYKVPLLLLEFKYFSSAVPVINTKTEKSKLFLVLCYLFYYSVSIDIVTDFPPFFEFVDTACLHFSMLRVEN